MRHIAFYNPHKGQYFRGYGRTADPIFGEVPLLYPDAVLTIWILVKRHPILLDCVIHYFDVERVPGEWELQPNLTPTKEQPQAEKDYNR